MRLKDLLSHIDSDSKGDLIAVARTLLAGNLGEEATQQELVALLDDLLPWEDFIKGPVGGLLEASDGPILRLVARGIVNAAKRKN